MTKEALADVVTWLCKNENKTVQEAIEALGLQSISSGDLEKSIAEIVEKNRDLVKKRGEGSFGALMGMVMIDLRGKADAEIVSRILKEKIKELAR